VPVLEADASSTWYSGGNVLAVHRRNVAILAAASLLTATLSCSSQPSPFEIELATADGNARVRVSGLSSTEASALRTARLGTGEWQSVLHVRTDKDQDVALAGAYMVSGTAIEFQPAFGLDPGRTYYVRFDPARLPEARAGGIVTAELTLPAGEAPPAVEVTGIFPSAAEWPANLLRFYVHFSGPMAREVGAGRVHILDDTGEEVADALLPAAPHYWSPDQTRYTVFFEPGRVKRGIQPNRDMGRALVPGRAYTIAVDQDWRDALGRQLRAPFRRTIRAAPDREYPLSFDRWRISSPPAGSTEPLILSVPDPLDRALFQRTVGIISEGQPLEGQVEVFDHETGWRFTPAAPWRRVAHELVVLSTLEDPAGNRIGRAFEVLPTDPSANAQAPERFTLPVTIR
jgi:hypothetical protein